jgi:3'(2'), 5'-bisphosphate nucleotidase
MQSEFLPVVLSAIVEASQAITRIYESGFSAEYKDDGSPVTQADYASNEILEKRLLETGLPLLTEENEHAPYEERKNWERLWCVDPLDGTKEFVKKNGEFAINVALVENNRAVFGAIAHVIEKKVLVGGTDIPAAVIGFDSIGDPKKWEFIEPREKAGDPLVVASSRTPHYGETLDYLQKLKKRFGEPEFIRKGSSLKFFDLALGHADFYPRFAPTMEWDIAAGQAIVESLGGSVVDAYSGRPLFYNKESLFNPHFIARTAAALKAEKDA